MSQQQQQFSQQGQPPQRNPIKSLGTSSSSSQRRAMMTERRMELSNRIRKQKRTHVVTLKRRYYSPSSERTQQQQQHEQQQQQQNDPIAIRSEGDADMAGGPPSPPPPSPPPPPSLSSPSAVGIAARPQEQQPSSTCTTATTTAAAAVVRSGESAPSTGQQSTAGRRQRRRRRSAIRAKLYDLIAAFITTRDGTTLSTLQNSLARVDEEDVTAIESLLSTSTTTATSSGQNEYDVMEEEDDKGETWGRDGGGAAAAADGEAYFDSLHLGITLANALAQTLTSPTSSDDMRMDASRVLTNLAATGAGSATTRTTGSLQGGEGGGGEDDENYYGVEEGWCEVLIHSQALLALVEVVTQFASAYVSSPPSSIAVALCEQCTWAIGNIAGDSQFARDAVRRIEHTGGGAIRPLVTTLRLGFYWARRQQQQQPTIPPPARGLQAGEEEVVNTVGLCRNAAWAISNLARGASTSAHPFLAGFDITTIQGEQQQQQQQQQSGRLFTGTDLGELLASPEIIRDYDDTGGPSVFTPTTSSWFDVANEVCWIVAFLTAKEDDAVDFLCRNDSPICQAVAGRLYRASEDASTVDKQASDFGLRIAIPCIRIVGNIATACDGLYVSSLLIATMGRDYQHIVSSLTKLIRLGAANGGDFASVAAEAAWAAGTLLCDAGLPLPHPSTAACQVLVPALCAAMTSGYSPLELKREVASALWNAVATPPVSVTFGADGVATPRQSEDFETLALRNQILTEIASTERLIFTITDLLWSFDADAVYASVRLVDAFLRRLPQNTNIRRLFEEAGGPDALETICDRASASSPYGQDKWPAGYEGSATSKSADIAADLLDDIFGEEILDRDSFEEESSSPGSGINFSSSSGGEVFPFGANKFDSSGAFLTGSGSMSDSDQALRRENVLPFGQESGPVLPVGRGRGRGKTIPAWMQQKRS